MDNQTINTYNQEAEIIAKLHKSLTPRRIYKLIEENFNRNEPTLDMGCGIGRDTHWLNTMGYPAIGVDASEAMLKQASALYPENRFIHDGLPKLSTLPALKFKNILCSAVLMHLQKDDLIPALMRLLCLLDDDGNFILSFRGSHEADNREKGKLYQPIIIEDILTFFEKKYCEVVLYETETEASRNLVWHNLVVKK